MQFKHFAKNLRLDIAAARGDTDDLGFHIMLHRQRRKRTTSAAGSRHSADGLAISRGREGVDTEEETFAWTSR